MARFYSSLLNVSAVFAGKMVKSFSNLFFFFKSLIDIAFFLSLDVIFWHGYSDSYLVILISWRIKWVINFLQLFAAFQLCRYP